MSLLLIDTDIASFIFKGSTYADPYRPLIQDQELALSFMTVAELFQWAMLRNWGDRSVNGNLGGRLPLDKPRERRSLIPDHQKAIALVQARRAIAS